MHGLRKGVTYKDLPKHIARALTLWLLKTDERIILMPPIKTSSNFAYRRKGTEPAAYLLTQPVARVASRLHARCIVTPESYATNLSPSFLAPRRAYWARSDIGTRLE